MKKKFTVLLAVMLVCTFALAACGNKNGESAGKKDTLVIAYHSMPATLDPAGPNDSASTEIVKQLYNTLLYQGGKDWSIEPGLATQWEYENPQTLNMTIREGVKFHNGEEVKASDVKFSIERAIASPYTSAKISMVDEVVVTGDYTFTFKLHYPFAPFLNHLAHTATSIVSEKAVVDAEAAGSSLAERPVGSGPFKFESSVTGDNVVISRFDDYYGDAPALKTITFKIIPEQSNRVIEVETGGADIAYNISPDDMKRVEDHSDMILLRAKNFATAYVGFNVQKEPFDNKLVRQAISYAIDTQAIVDKVYGGTGVPAYGPLTDNVWGSAELDPYEYDLEKAKQLMIEAGYPDGFDTVIWYNTDSMQRGDTSEIVQNMLKAININVKVEAIEWATYLERTNAAEHEMFNLGWTTSTNDPDETLYANFHSTSFGANGNRTFFNNGRVDELLDMARRELDQEKRREMYKEMQEIIREEAPWVFVHQGETLVATGSSVRGFEISPAGNHKLWTVYFE